MFVCIFFYNMAIKYELTRSIWKILISSELELLKVEHRHRETQNIACFKKLCVENSACLWLDYKKENSRDTW